MDITMGAVTYLRPFQPESELTRSLPDVAGSMKQLPILKQMADIDTGDQSFLSWDVNRMDTPDLRKQVEAFGRCCQEISIANVSGVMGTATTTWVDKKKNKLIIVLTSLEARMMRLQESMTAVATIGSHCLRTSTGTRRG